jgi:hypothetical protein
VNKDGWTIEFPVADTRDLEWTVVTRWRPAKLEARFSPLSVWELPVSAVDSKNSTQPDKPPFPGLDIAVAPTK